MEYLGIGPGPEESGLFERLKPCDGPHQSRIEKLAGHKLTVSTSTSGEGLLALLKGEADLAMISASLDGMIELLRKTTPDLPFGRLREFRISQARIHFRRRQSRAFGAAFKAQADPGGGQIGNWRELGGPDILLIHVVSLREGGGAKRATKESLFGGQRLTPRSEIVVDSALKVVQTVDRIAARWELPGQSCETSTPARASDQDIRPAILQFRQPR